MATQRPHDRAELVNAHCDVVSHCVTERLNQRSLSPHRYHGNKGLLFSSGHQPHCDVVSRGHCHNGPPTELHKDSTG